MAGTPVNPSSPYSGQNAPVSIGIPAIAASHPGFIRESPSGELKPTGSGGAILPLSNALWVDQGAVDASGDGSIATPFKTLTDAVAAGNALGKTAVTLFITQYNYSEEAALVTGVGIKYSFIGLGGGTEENTTQLPNITANGDCYFKNVFAGSVTAGTADFIELFYEMSSGLAIAGVEGGALNVSVVGGTNSFDPNGYNGTINGPITNAVVVILDGGTVVASSETCSARDWTLRNGSVVSVGTINCRNLALYADSHVTAPSGVTGDGVGKMIVEDSAISGVLSSFVSASTFRGAKFSGITNLDFQCSMDVDSYFSFFSTGGNTSEEIISLTGGEPSCRVPRGDNENFIDMNGQAKIVIPAGVLTADRSVALASSDSITKQLLIFDSFAHEGFTWQMRDGATGLPLYTFLNQLGSPAVWRATIIVLDALGNSFGLFSVEPIFWVHP